MNWLISYLFIYVLGGITFIPLVLICLWLLLPQKPSDPEERERIEHKAREIMSEVKGLPPGYSDLKTTEIYYNDMLNVKTVFEGWITVTQEFYNLPQIHAEDFKAAASGSSLGTETESTGFIRRVKNTATGGGGSSGSNDSGSSGSDSTKEGVNYGDNDNFDARQLKQVRKKYRFYGVLKHSNLFLYKDDTKSNLQHAIVLNSYLVSIWPRNLTDAKLFTKYSAICLLKKEVVRNEKTVALSDKELLYLLHKGTNNTPLPAGSYFCYGDNNHAKEDWYFSLLRATTDPSVGRVGTNADLLNPALNAKPLFFNTKDAMHLLQTINSTEGQLSTKWLNALLGRLFLSVYKTPQYKDALKAKFEEKLGRIRTPGFLDELQIGRIDVGDSAPFITEPKLKQLSPEGDLIVEMVIDYSGGLSLEIDTKVFLNLGSHFKQREFDVHLSVRLQKLHGNLIVVLKQVPSNRVWYSFVEEPEMQLFIEPNISSRSINYNLVTNALEKKFKDAIRTSLVYPFMDDIVFFKTSEEIFRGGIWDHTKPRRAPPAKPIPTDGIGAASSGTSDGSPNGGGSGDGDGDAATDSDSASHASQVPLAKGSNSDADSVSIQSGQPSERSFSSSLPHSLSMNDPTGIRPMSSPAASSVSSSNSKVSATLNKNKVTRKLLEKGVALKEKGRESLNLDDQNSEINQAAAQLKQGVSTGVTKFKKWYAKRGASDSVPQINTYTPPEMISSRRRKPSVSDKMRSQAEEFTPVTTKDSSTTSVDMAKSPSSPEMFINEKFRRSSVTSSPRANRSYSNSVSSRSPSKNEGMFTEVIDGQSEPDIIDSVVPEEAPSAEEANATSAKMSTPVVEGPSTSEVSSSTAAEVAAESAHRSLSRKRPPPS